MSLRNKLMTAATGLLLASCASQQAVHDEVNKLKTGPSATPHRSITNFASGLRCMDNMMIDYGIKDISMLVEDLEDQTSKVNAGTKDMLITAVSSMTRRSRAVKLIPFGNDSGNLISFLGAAGSQSAYNVIPQYDIRGSISQLDSSVVRKQAGGSVAASKWGLGASASTAGSILGIDLSVLSTEDLSVLPGVTSSNAVVLFKSGKGGDADATIKKTGISFDFQVAKNEATVQALRNLIELASIELVGRLTKVPYWQCLEIPDDSPEIKQEMEDWFYAMRAHDELVPYVRSQLIARGFYPMAQTNPSEALRSAIIGFQRSEGVSPLGKLDYAFFKHLLTGKPAAGSIVTVAQKPAGQPAPTQAAVFKPTQATPTNTASSSHNIAANPAPSPINLSLATASGKTAFNRGETISLLANADSSGYLFCFYTDADNNTQRFFPNRFQTDNFVSAGDTVKLPGSMPFDITANENGATEYITCFASQQNVYHNLPAAIRTYDFEDLDVRSLEEVRQGFSAASNGTASEAQFAIKTR